MHTHTAENTVYSANFTSALANARWTIERDEKVLAEARSLPDAAPLVAHLVERVDAHRAHMAAFDLAAEQLREAEALYFAADAAHKEASGARNAGSLDQKEAARLLHAEGVTRQAVDVRARALAPLTSECRARLDAVLAYRSDPAAQASEKPIMALARTASTAARLVVTPDPAVWLERESPAIVMWEPLYIVRALASYPDLVREKPRDGLPLDELRKLYARRVETRRARAAQRRADAAKVLASP